MIFKVLESLKNECFLEVEEHVMKDFSENPVLMTYDINFKNGIIGCVEADYFTLEVGANIKFTSDAWHETDEVKYVLSELTELQSEIKNYFKNLREKT